MEQITTYKSAVYGYVFIGQRPAEAGQGPADILNILCDTAVTGAIASGLTVPRFATLTHQLTWMGSYLLVTLLATLEEAPPPAAPRTTATDDGTQA